ncbi:hypothetical protein LB505_008640 [Fusarium chuoi]|nr:hypothetical protein LB505_008640 [Fusarium chuoi]
MKASVILTTILTTSAWASTLPTKRQNAANEAALQQAREDSVKAIEGGQGRGRLLFDEGNCSEACIRCRVNAVATAVAVDVLTAGIATFLEAAGFVACEAAVVTTLNEEKTGLKE